MLSKAIFGCVERDVARERRKTMSYLDKKTTLQECLGLMGPETHKEITERLQEFGSEGLLIFENVDLSDRNVGEVFAIGYGPNNTIKKPPEDGKCPVIPPNGRAWQYYLKAYS